MLATIYIRFGRWSLRSFSSTEVDGGTKTDVGVHIGP